MRLQPPWAKMPEPIAPVRPLRPYHHDDCHLEHPQCATARIERAREAAQEILNATHASPGARRAAETLSAILTGRDKTQPDGAA